MPLVFMCSINYETRSFSDRKRHVYFFFSSFIFIFHLSVNDCTYKYNFLFRPLPFLNLLLCFSAIELADRICRQM